MISLRKHIDNYKDLGGEPARAAIGMPEPVVSEFRAVLLAIRQSAGRAVAHLGVELNREITEIQKALVEPVTAGLLTATGGQARNELPKWADRALSHHQANQREVREIVSAIAGAVESVGRRDKKYATEIGNLTVRLGCLAGENDLAVVRRSKV